MGRIIIAILIVLALAIASFFMLMPAPPEISSAEPQDQYLLRDQGTFQIEENGKVIREERFQWLQGAQHGWWILTAERISAEDHGTQKLVLNPMMETISLNLEISQTGGPKLVISARIDSSNKKATISSKAAFLPAFTKEIALEQSGLIIDVTFFSSYYALLEIMKTQSTADPQFIGIVPSRLGAWPMNIESLEPVTIKTEADQFQTDRFSVSFGDIDADLLVRDGQLLGVSQSNPARIAYRSEQFAQGFQLIDEPPVIAKTPDSVSESEVLFTSKDGVVLAGSLTVPVRITKKLPAVLMISGGPSDRNENLQGLKINTFNAIAWELAQQGIASFRYDKRGVGNSQGNPRTGFLTPQLDDAEAAYQFLSSNTEIDPERIFILGHSEGGLLGEALAAQESVAGLIILTSSAARSFEWNWLWQQEAELVTLGISESDQKADLEKWRQLFEFVKQSQGEWDDYPWEDVVKTFPKMDETYYKAVQRQSLSWWKEILLFDPLTTVSQVLSPILIIQGGKDWSVPFDEGNLIAKALADEGNHQVQFELIPDLNHFLRHHPEPADPINSLLHLESPIDQRVIDTIIAWLKNQLVLSD